ncbi:hypothetical protein K450DRAFT_218723 [Umbelopsis ramanniana AG]|uniref:NodB homology domain-containing protein n=1 Tax=Umbelopsis ramanniana AG TaxID=1314678 RepID=A0AAD5HJE2_UMBRA|nr:uncharacterized protein K450DRAFT_218723 [Umbelopsis ramanniana AG]KAI8584223.1 hypothetical protein K450DRAFT_218723 [Umbelopsis ramanniana AG]
MHSLVYLAFALLLSSTLVSTSPITRRTLTGVQTDCKKGYFALTYDDGPYEFTEELVDKLDAAGIKATFFVNGKNWWDIKTDSNASAAIEKAYNSGHQIASHTYSHADLDSLDAAGVTSEMTDLEAALEKAIGVKPAFMRPPYGNSNSGTTSTLNSLGYTVVTWNVDSKDYETHNLNDELTNYKNELGPITGPGGIALEHDVYQQTVEELTDKAIEYVQGMGYKFATIAECFNSQPYQ